MATAWARSDEIDPKDEMAVERMAMATALEAIRDGLSLESTAAFCLTQALRHLALDFGSVYVKRHDYLTCVASTGWRRHSEPDPILGVDPTCWPRRPFLAQQSGVGGGELGREKTWLSLPLSIHDQLVGLLVLGSYGHKLDDLPRMAVARKLAGTVALAIDNAERIGTLRTVLNDTRDVVFRTDEHGRLTFLNTAWRETFGLPVGAALGQRLTSFVAPAERRKLGGGIEALVPRGSVIGRQTLLFITHGGKERWLDVQARLIRDDRGDVAGVAGVLRDVSRSVLQARELARVNRELQRRAEELEQANRELAEIDRVKSEFLHTVSHELRTPLNVALGYAELLRDGVPDDPSDGQVEYLDFVLEGIHRLNGLIGDLLELTRIEAGRITIERRPQPIWDSIGQAVADMADALEQNEVAIDQGARRPPLKVLAEPERLEQVLRVLLDNAVKFSAAGGLVRVRVEPVAELEPVLPAPQAVTADVAHYAQVCIVDDGVGVPPERLPHLFRKFVQADGGDTREHGGLGIGLVIAKALVEMMGGRIALHSDGEGCGAIAAFTVPLITLRSRPAGDE